MSIMVSPRDSTANISSFKTLQNEHEFIKVWCSDLSILYLWSFGVFP